MLTFAARRLLMAVPTVIIVCVLVFFLVRLFPGDPAQILLGDQASPDALTALRKQLGLDRSISVQFVIWLKHAIEGDLGNAVVTGQPAFRLALDAYWVSLTMAIPAVLIATLVAVPLGTLAAWKQNSATDTALVGFAAIILSIPTFFSGLLILFFFGLWLQYFPIVGYVSPFENPRAGIAYLTMPILTLVLNEIGVLLRMVRGSSLEVLRLDYITHARAKGAGEGRVLRGHVLKNAFGPTWTLIGLLLGNLVGSIAVVETVFTIPGIGRLIVDSVYQRDYPVIQACLLLVAVSYVGINTLVDLLYPVFDPRVTRS